MEKMIIVAALILCVVLCSKGARAADLTSEAKTQVATYMLAGDLEKASQCADIYAKLATGDAALAQAAALKEQSKVIARFNKIGDKVEALIAIAPAALEHIRNLPAVRASNVTDGSAFNDRSSMALSAIQNGLKLLSDPTADNAKELIDRVVKDDEIISKSNRQYFENRGE